MTFFFSYPPPPFLGSSYILFQTNKKIVPRESTKNRVAKTCFFFFFFFFFLFLSRLPEKRNKQTNTEHIHHTREEARQSWPWFVNWAMSGTSLLPSRKSRKSCILSHPTHSKPIQREIGERWEGYRGAHTHTHTKMSTKRNVLRFIHGTCAG